MLTEVKAAAPGHARSSTFVVRQGKRLRVYRDELGRFTSRTTPPPHDLEPAVRALLDLRFPAEGRGASLDKVGAELAMSPAMVAHIEFAALCAIAARKPRCTGVGADAASGAI